MLANQNNTIDTIEMIYEKHAALMYGCIYKLVEQKDTANKILSEVFIDLYNRKEEYSYSIDDTVWFLKKAVKAAFHFIKEGHMAEEFPLKVMQQVLEIKSGKYLQVKCNQTTLV